jgi:hypothetical protein
MKEIKIAVVTALAAGLAQAAPMMTTWGEKVTPENAWRGYPRPQWVHREIYARAWQIARICVLRIYWRICVLGADARPQTAVHLTRGLAA